ncbi:hypothetical protein WAI453_001792 [Rhynchosporium graminicola]
MALQVTGKTGLVTGGGSINSWPLYAASKAGISSFVHSLGPLEAQCNIRFVAVAPAIVNTPIWAERSGWVDKKVDAWISPSRIAEVMLDVVQGHKIGRS